MSSVAFSALGTPLSQWVSTNKERGRSRAGEVRGIFLCGGPATGACADLVPTPPSGNFQVAGDARQGYTTAANANLLACQARCLVTLGLLFIDPLGQLLLSRNGGPGSCDGAPRMSPGPFPYPNPPPMPVSASQGQPPCDHPPDSRAPAGRGQIASDGLARLDSG